MSNNKLEHLSARLGAHERLLLILGRAVVAQLKGQGAKQLSDQLDEVESELGSLQPPPSSNSWSNERRARASQSMKTAWEQRRQDQRLFLFEYQGEDPSRVTYEEAASLLGYSASTLRVRISQAPSRSIALYKGGRHLVLAKTEDGLAPALSAKHAETGHPDDLISLPARAKKAAGVR